MRLKKEFVTVPEGDSAITVSTDTSLFSGMMRSNKTAAYIISCMQDDISLDEICLRVKNKYDVDDQTVRNDVENIVEQLRAIDAIDD